ncbi:MAG: DUF881 domain-containing protein [Acidibacillus sp.]|nr:DUF881 domain-containing protein [Acidibacillus sp.]
MDLKQLLPAKRKMIAWTIVAFVFGTMMSVQYHDVELGGAALWAGSPDVASVNARLVAVQNYNKQVYQKTKQITQQILQLQDQALAQGGEMAHVERELRAARILAGTVPLVGPGVSVTISDGKMDEVAMAQFITHDWDLRSVVNELFAAGADAVSINSARVTETTGIFCVGPVVRVGTMQIGPPFIIRAIGQSGVLSAALNLPGGPLDILRGANRGLSVSNPIQEKMISIPAYQTPLVITGGGTS